MKGLLAVVAFLLVVGAVFVVYSPALELELMGDDYQWVQHAHHATHRPALLLADLGTFYRPANTWSLAVDRVWWGWRPMGFHLTNLILHTLVACLLLAAGRRLGLSLPVAAGGGLLWGLSPLASEPAISVAIRFQNLLAAAWLGLIVAWPHSDETWTRARSAAVAGCTFLAAASKETWVMTPALVAALELSRRDARLDRAVRAAAPFAAAAVVYVIVYFFAFPTGKSYFEPTASILAKVPHQLAVFLHLEPLEPAQFPFTWLGGLATVLVSAAVFIGWRRRLPAVLAGAALMIAPVLPTLLVPYLPQRYLAIPYAGLLLVVCGLAQHALTRARGRAREAVAAGLTAVALWVAAFDSLGVRAELADAERVSSAHTVLLAEARAVLPELSLERPTAVVRAERVSPLAEVAADPHGLAKPFFVRHEDPYGLVDAAALFECVLDEEGSAVIRHDDWPERFAGVSGDVLVHRAGGFDLVAGPAQDLAAAAGEWTAAGLPVRVIRAEPL